MAHNDTVFGQVLKLVPRHEFESLARKHKSGRMSRSMTRWSQFVAMGMAQLTGRCSLRDIVSNLAAQSCKLYHLGVGVVTRSSLARVNAEKPWRCTRSCTGDCWGAAKRRRRDMATGSKPSCSLWIRQPLTCVCRRFRGRSPVRRIAARVYLCRDRGLCNPRIWRRSTRRGRVLDRSSARQCSTVTAGRTPAEHVYFYTRDSPRVKYCRFDWRHLGRNRALFLLVPDDSP